MGWIVSQNSAGLTDRCEHFAKAGTTRQARTNSGIYPSSDLTHVMAPPLHGLQLTSFFPLRVL